jgi:peroxiredoxin Q/BCP
MRSELVKGFVVGGVAVFALLVGAGAVMARGMAGADTTPLQPGTKAPDFSLPSQEDKNVSLSQYKGKYVVLYFYPKDQTKGCTIEAHNFQRDMPKYDALNAVVLGVSLDTVEGHKAWCAKDTFSFKLLADPDHKVVDAYGVPVMMGTYAKRQTYLIGPDGKILKFWDVADVNKHSEDVLAAIAEFKK